MYIWTDFPMGQIEEMGRGINLPPQAFRGGHWAREVIWRVAVQIPDVVVPHPYPSSRITPRWPTRMRLDPGKCWRFQFKDFRPLSILIPRCPATILRRPCLRPTLVMPGPRPCQIIECGQTTRRGASGTARTSLIERSNYLGQSSSGTPNGARRL